MNKRLLMYSAILTSILIAIGVIIYITHIGSNTTTKTGANSTDELKSDYPMEVNVPLDKRWDIDFGSEINKKSLNYVYVKDSKGNKVKVKVTTANKKMYISPPQKGYKPDEHYEIHILKELTYKNGKNLKKPIRIDFLTKSKEKVDVKLSPKVKEMSFVPKNAQGQFNIMERDKVEVGDILVIPNEVGEKHAYKITKVIPPSQGSNGQIVETEDPSFLELFDNLDLNTSFPLTTDNTKLIPTQGVSLQEKVAYNFKNTYASSNKGASASGDFQLKDGKIVSFYGNIDSTIKDEMIEFTFDNFELRLNNTSYMLNGTLTLDSEVHVDIEKVQDEYKVNDYKLVSDSTIMSNLEYSFGSNQPIEPISVEIPLAHGVTAIPEFPVIQLEYSINFIAEVDLNGNLTLHLESKKNIDAGIIMNGYGNFDPFFYINNAEDVVDLKGTGKVDAKGGVSIETGLTIFGILGTGIELSGGFEAEGIAEVSTGNKELCLSYYMGAFFEANAYCYLLQRYEFPFKSLADEMEEYKESKRKRICEEYKEVIVKIGDSKNTTINLEPEYANFVEVVNEGNKIFFLNKELSKPKDDYLGLITSIPLSNWNSMDPDERTMLYKVYLKDGETVFVLSSLPEISQSFMEVVSIDEKLLKRHLGRIERLKYYLLKVGFKNSGITEIRQLPPSLDIAEKAGVEYLDYMTNEFLGPYFNEIKIIKDLGEWNDKKTRIGSEIESELDEFGSGSPPLPNELDANYSVFLNKMISQNKLENEWSLKNEILELESVYKEINAQLQKYKNLPVK